MPYCAGTLRLMQRLILVLLVSAQQHNGGPLQRTLAAQQRHVSQGSKSATYQQADVAHSSAWCQAHSHSEEELQWHQVPVSARTVLGKQDVYTCTKLQVPSTADSDQLYVRTALQQSYYDQQLLTLPASGKQQSQESCTAPNTAFGKAADLSNRVLVLQAHWRMPAPLTDKAVQLPELTLKLAAISSPAAQPALLGTFVGSGVYPPFSLSHNLKAFTVAAQGSSAGQLKAELSCGRRCTFLNLGRTWPKPVNVVGYSFNTFDRATAVAIEIKRGAAGRVAGHKIFPGDVFTWRCTYNASGSLGGGYSSSKGSQQEQCTMMLHYWPRVESMRGCLAATLSDPLLGENMCSHEVEEMLRITAVEDKQFPIRRMHQEHSFPHGAWMGGWKATHLVMFMGMVLATLWASHNLLSSCKALGSWHRRYRQLDQGQQRNVSLYITHLLLDSVLLAVVSQPMVELWMGWSETTADVQRGGYAFVYLVACYAMELTWRRSIDTMLAVHHVGTIAIITLYAGEYSDLTYRVANNIIVLASFALIEQPTYVALLCKRMLPAHSPFVVMAARVGYISWFALKGLSVLIAIRMYIEDWHIMPIWLRVNFGLTWVVASLVQGWSGMIQYSIYKQIYRSYLKASWQYQQEQRKQRTAAVLAAGAEGYGMCMAATGHAGSKFSEGVLDLGQDTVPGQQQDSQLISPLLSPIGSQGSDCIAAEAEDEQDSKSFGPSSMSSLQLQGCSSPGSSGSLGDCNRVAELSGFERGVNPELGFGAVEDVYTVDKSGEQAMTPAAGGCTELFGLAGVQLAETNCISGCPDGSSGGSSSAQLRRHTDGLQRRTNQGSLA
eukprot:gene11784-11929_t